METLSGKAGRDDHDEVLYWRCRVELWRTVTEESGSEEQRSASARHYPGHRACAIQGERHANEWCGGSKQRNSQFESSGCFSHRRHLKRDCCADKGGSRRRIEAMTVENKEGNQQA